MRQRAKKVLSLFFLFPLARAQERERVLLRSVLCPLCLILMKVLFCSFCFVLFCFVLFCGSGVNFKRVVMCVACSNMSVW